VDKDQRRFSRVPFDTETLLSSDGQCWRCHLIDISIKGALVDAPTDAEFKVNQSAQLEVNLDQSGIIITMDMTVAHITNHHLGLKCEKIDAESIAHLRRLVELNLGDAELINRELMQLGS
jgi:hypothetical protein